MPPPLKTSAINMSGNGQKLEYSMSKVHNYLKKKDPSYSQWNYLHTKYHYSICNLCEKYERKLLIIENFLSQLA